MPPSPRSKRSVSDWGKRFRVDERSLVSKYDQLSIFFEHEDYLYFLRLIRKHLVERNQVSQRNLVSEQSSLVKAASLRKTEE